jgi:hypothetical protein
MEYFYTYEKVDDIIENTPGKMLGAWRQTDRASEWWLTLGPVCNYMTDFHSRDFKLPQPYDIFVLPGCYAA